MPDYRRNRVPGGTYFFTVNLLERRNRLLIENIDTFREVVRCVRTKHSFFHRLVAAGIYPSDYAGVDEIEELQTGEQDE